MSFCRPCSRTATFPPTLYNQAVNSHVCCERVRGKLACFYFSISCGGSGDPFSRSFINHVFIFAGLNIQSAIRLAGLQCDSLHHYGYHRYSSAHGATKPFTFRLGRAGWTLYPQNRFSSHPGFPLVHLRPPLLATGLWKD